MSGSLCSRVGCLRLVATQVPDEWLSTTEPGLSADFHPTLYFLINDRHRRWFVGGLLLLSQHKNRKYQ